MIGTQLGGRYEILERIGGGGMAIVYKGHDILLHRKVAIKVLRQQFVSDEEFIRRFRREAQAAASLSHPNVVSIYDVGQDEDIHYIVMEYVEGTNLNEKIKEQAPLQVDEAVRIAGQICDALDHAHHNQIIHRDIKPHNILIGKNGRVKVTDFGIARATTSSTITQTGSVIGSVHYFSPEHAKGVTAGAQSDLYSLGIVLYQMLTARLPFLGESPISVALKHLQEHVEEPRKVNPLIPQSVENIVLRAMRKNPQDRYRSAKEMLDDLDSCLLPQRRNEQKIVFAGENEEDEEKTRVIPAIRPEHQATNQWNGKGLETEPQEEYEEDNGKSRGGWVKPIVWSVVTVLLVGLLWFGYKEVSKWMVVPEVTVPNVVDMSLKDAEAELAKYNLYVEKPVTEMFSDKEKDTVLEQEKTNMKVKEKTTIKLVVSKGAELLKIDDYTGRKLADATEELKKQGYKEDQIKVTSEDFSEDEAGTILKQTPEANTEIDPKTVTIEFVVSKGPESVKMPNLIGLNEKDARQTLKDNNIMIAKDGVKTEESTFPAGQVFKQWPFKAGDPVTPDQEVIIYISTGPPQETLTTTYEVEVAPAEEGKTSSVKIIFSDATGENIEWGTKKISAQQKIPIEVTTTPSKNAVIQVFTDNVKTGHYTFTYKQAQEMSKAKPASTQGGSSGSGESDGGGGHETGGQQTGNGDGASGSTAEGNTSGGN